MIIQILKFILFGVQKMILYQTVVNISKKTVSFLDIVLFIDEENIVTYVELDCGITFYPDTPKKIRQINWEQNFISRTS